MTAAEETRIMPRVRALPRTCVLFALPHERKAFKFNTGPELRVVETGSGAANAARAASGVLAAYDDDKPTVIVCGFGGGLTPSMNIGDLLIAESVVDATEGLDYPKERLTPDADLVATAIQEKINGARIHKGVLVTANRVLITAHEKREWARRSGAIGVDMETAAAGLAARQSGARWICVRCITDDSESDLPLDFNRLTDDDGNLKMSSLTLATIMRPWAIPGLRRLGKSSELAGRNLAQFLESFLRRLPQSDDTAVTGE
jgi:adenosylhomocysteine nucleosidase